jgi:putative addiction module antidote
MHKLKLRAVGNSLGLILPKATLDKLGLKEGDHVLLTEAPDGFRITPATAEFERAMTVAEDVASRHRTVLRELAKD